MIMDWLEYENKAYESGYNIVCGVDEAGRGPLAGPVYAAAADFFWAQAVNVITARNIKTIYLFISYLD